MLGACNFQGNNAPNNKMEEQRSVAEELIDETTRLLGGGSSRQSKPPRLSIPIHGFATPGGAVEHHLGHIIRPMTARSLSRHSLRIDTHSTGFPRTTSTNGSISSRLVRQPMTPRVGIRTSVFGAIEFQQHVKAMRRATSSNQFPGSPSMTTNNQLRRRQISMPHWGKQSNTGGMSSTSVAATTATPGVHVSYGARSATIGRPRASTVNDHLLTTQRPNNNNINNNGPMSPDSTGSSTGLAEDYFAYLSANQHNQCPMTELPEQQVCRSGTDLTIPEIRLAPPNNAMHPSSPSESRRLRRGSTSLHVPPSPSIANTEDDIYVSARQSPAVSPSPSMYYVPHHQSPDHRSISIVLSHVDNHGDSPFVQRALEPHFALPETRVSCTSCVTACCPQLMDSIRQTLFPTMQDWCEKSWFSKLSTLVAVPLVLVFTLTLPVAEQEGGVQVDDFQMLDEDEDNDPAKHLYLPVTTDDGYSDIMADDPLMQDEFQQQQQPWCRWLLALQAVCGTTFLAVIMAINEFIAPVHIVFGFAAGCMLAGLVFIGTDADKPPKWSWMLSFVGFFVALNWIFFLANNMVGLLKALGMIFDISEAIMGLTVFALGNSIGDFVANTAIAKMGFPTMAISACYAGPLLNMVLGVGVSSSYQIFKTGKPYQLDIAPTILVSAAGLIMVLLSTLVVVNLNGYYINKRLGIWMIAIYMICCIINVTLEWGIAV
ncbi:hypothetical protein LRAMOSA08022 [Lichtheimia ramosa]|uniref:Sodium/calcium exchanger membrane region domain-containing protein n=1 Tax=Lichtheimia ramosa TaxID=688394 RepID=A0A077WEC7_9FUNG|nr:hypothetical protein LRAMOSA08022 [Lichtheimia ramosa]